MTNRTFQIGISEYARKRIANHERWRGSGHSVKTLVMRRRLSYEDFPLDKPNPGNVVYWSWHLCDCGWNCHGRVAMQNEPAQTELDLTQNGGGK